MSESMTDRERDNRKRAEAVMRRSFDDIDDLDLARSFAEQAIDSLDIVALSIDLEYEFHTKIADQTLNTFTNGESVLQWAAKQ